MRFCRVQTFIPIIIGIVALTSCHSSPGSNEATSESAATPPGVQTVTRIVTLSPHLAELIHDIGAGDVLVGVSAYTDYPAATLDLPIVGDAFALDLEQLAVLQPDLLIAWQSGTPERVVDELQERGYRVAIIQTESIGDVPRALRELGSLTGQERNAGRVADRFSADIDALASAHRDAEPISVFYQVARRPLYTVSDAHYVSDLIKICGGRNVFAELDDLAPMISTEAVLERDPEVLLASSDSGPDAFVDWDRWNDLAANRYSNRYQMPANEIGRATPRLLVAAKAMCEALNEGRERRSAYAVSE